MSLKFALLGLLAESPKYGYEIKRRFEGAIGNVWSVSYGQLYPTLRRLAELGYVTKKTEPGKKAADKNIYSITEKGRKKIDEWLLKPLRTRVYFGPEARVRADPALAALAASPRLATLLATPQAEGRYRWDVRLQGDGETVFFAA